MKYIFYLMCTILFCNCHSNCIKTYNSYATYQQAVNEVENADFKISDSVNTSKSLGIQSAHYYSCDGVTGYFIFKAQDKEYIHRDMPLEVWNGFKNASSFGSYYNHFIKHKYQFYLSN